MKCRESGLIPSVVTLVATVRALKMHGGGPKVTPGAPLQKEYTEENVALLEAGCNNLVRHVQNATKFGVPVVVAINRFTTDTDNEVDAIKKAAMDAGAFDAVVASHWADGGAGAKDLAEAVVKAAAQPVDFKLLYVSIHSLHRCLRTCFAFENWTTRKGRFVHTAIWRLSGRSVIREGG